MYIHSLSICADRFEVLSAETDGVGEYIYIYMYVCMCVCIYIYIYVHVHVNICNACMR